MQVSNSSQVSGTIVVRGGCSFSVKNFLLFPPAINAYFYGSQSLNDVGFRVCDFGLGAFNGQDMDFNLSGTDKKYSWSEFSVLKIYSELTKETLAYAVQDTSKDKGSLDAKSVKGDASTCSRVDIFSFVTVLLGMMLA